MWEFKSHCRRVVCTDHGSAVPRPARGARLYTLYPEPETANPWPSPGTEGEALPLVHPVADVGLELRRHLLAAGASAEGAGSSALAAGANLTECMSFRAPLGNPTCRIGIFDMCAGL